MLEMFTTIRKVAGNGVNYLRIPTVYAALEGFCIAAPYGVIAFMLPGVFEGRLQQDVFWTGFLLIVLFYGLRILFSLKSYGGGLRAGYEAGTAVRLHLGEHLRKLPMGFFNVHDTGELTNRLFHNVAMVEMMISHFFTQSVANLTVPVVLFLFMPLFFPAGKRRARFSDHGAVTFRQRHDKIVTVRRPGCVFHFLPRCALSADTDIVEERIVKQIHLLKHHADGSEKNLRG